MDHSPIYIDVKVYGGVLCREAIEAMTALAARLQIAVWATMNGVRVMARPNDDAAALYAVYDLALLEGRKVASLTPSPALSGEE